MPPDADGRGGPRFDVPVRAVEAKTDAEERRALNREAHAPHNGRPGHVPLHHTMVPWAHRADNQVQVRETRLE